MTDKWLSKVRLPPGVRFTPVRGTGELEVKYRGTQLGVVWLEKGLGWKWAEDGAGQTGIAPTRNRAFQALCEITGHVLSWGHDTGVPKPTLPAGYLLKPGALRVVDELGTVAGWVVSFDIHGEQWAPAETWEGIPEALNGPRYATKEEATRALIGAAVDALDTGIQAAGGDCPMTPEQEEARLQAGQEPPAPDPREPVDGVFTDLWGVTPQPAEWVIEGVLPPGLTMVGGPPKSGKALALDTPIPTPTGWTTMGKVKAGDEVLSPAGRPVKVLAATEILTGRPCFRVDFDNGGHIIADAEHQWQTRQARYRGSAREWTPTISTTQEMQASLYTDFADGRLNHHVQLAQPLELPTVELPIPPYTLGVWLGDGHASGGQYTKPDLEVAAQVRADGFQVTQSKARPELWSVRGLKGLLRTARLLKNKHIPAEYLRGSIRQRLSLLQGLMDTDGTCSKRGECSFSSTTKALAEGVEELLGSLGIKSCRYSRIPKIPGQPEAVCQREYRVSFHSDLPVFRLPRKLSRQILTGRKREYRAVTAVTPMPSVPVRCIQVEGELFLAGRHFIPTHNSMLTLAMAALVEGLECQVLPESMSRIREHGCVFLFSAEMSAQELQDAMVQGLHVQGEPDESLLVVDDVFQWQLDDPDAVNKMLGWMERRHPKLVIIDPLRNFHRLDERDSSIIHLFTPLRNWAKKNRSAIVVVHHTTKPTEDTKYYTAHHLRGSGGLFGVADAILMITPLDEMKFGRWKLKATFKRAPPWERDIQLQMWDQSGPAHEVPLGDVEQAVYGRMSEQDVTGLVHIRRNIKLPHERIMAAIETLVRAQKIRRVEGGWEKVRDEQ